MRSSLARSGAHHRILIADEPVTRPRCSWPWWRWGLTGLSALGLGLSGFLSWHFLEGGAMIGCGGGSPCDDVLNSRWSMVAGVVPVSGLAASAYLAMLICSVSIGPANAAPVRRLAWDTLRVLAGAAAGSAVWFTIVQRWLVGAFCPYCMATHLTSLLLTGLVIWCSSRASGDDRSGMLATDGPGDGVGPAIARVLAGLALAAILVVAQIGLAPGATARSGESLDPLASPEARGVPLVGSPEARYVVTLLFDYKCPHCQQLHLMLGEAVRRYKGKLAFALCPSPLNRRCNPYVPRDVDEFRDSCELTRIALAVWLADRTAFPAFDDWMYSFDSGDRWRPRTLDEAEAKAIELVGAEKLAAARIDPWIDHYIESSVRIYGRTMQNGTGGVPKMVFGSRWVAPQPGNATDLVSILQTHLGVPAR